MEKRTDKSGARIWNAMMLRNWRGKEEPANGTEEEFLLCRWRMKDCHRSLIKSFLKVGMTNCVYAAGALNKVRIEN